MQTTFMQIMIIALSFLIPILSIIPPLSAQEQNAIIAYSDGTIIPVNEENRKILFGDELVREKELFVSHDVTFDIQYQDVNTGFNDPVLGNQRKQVLRTALEYVADVLNVPGGKMEVNVSSVVIAGQYLANAGPLVVWSLPLTPGINNGCAYQHLLNGTVDPSGPNYPDMQITVNWNYSYYLGTENPPSNQYDLLSILIHEITHCIGFLSAIAYNDPQCGGNRPTGTGWTGSQPDIYTSYDTFLITGNNNYFINSSFYYIGQNYYFTGGDNGVYLDASNTVNTYGSRPRIYAPSSYQCGSSISHWNNLGGVMDPTIGPGTVKREYKPFEIALLRDIGFINASLPSSMEGEGTSEGSGEGSTEGEEPFECYYITTCPDFDREGNDLYVELANLLQNPAIQWSDADLDGGGIPDSWEIAVLARVLCKPLMYWRFQATCVYLKNLQRLQSEPQYDAKLKNYEHVLAGLCTISSGFNTFFTGSLDLINEYDVFVPISKSLQEILSATGDADGDGLVNKQEYDNCIVNGLGKVDYVIVVLNKALDGTKSPEEALPVVNKYYLYLILLFGIILISWIIKARRQHYLT